MEHTSNTATAEPKTIRELLTRTLQTRETNGAYRYALGKGAHADGYAFASGAKGLEDFVIRIDRNKVPSANLTNLLKGSTQLTPVAKLFSGAPVGQALIQFKGDDGFTIHMRQRGLSLEELIKHSITSSQNTGESPKEKALIAKTAIMEAILNPSTKVPSSNLLLPIFQTSYNLLKIGYEPDYAINNLLFDEAKGTLSLIDQLNNSSESDHSNEEEFPLSSEYALVRLEQEIKYLLIQLEEDCQGTTPEARHYQDVYRKFKNLANHAYQSVTDTYAQHDTNLCFKDVTDVKAISLDDPPHVLVEMLRNMEQRTAIPAR